MEIEVEKTNVARVLYRASAFGGSSVSGFEWLVNVCLNLRAAFESNH